MSLKNNFLMPNLWIFCFWLLLRPCDGKSLYGDAAEFCLNNGLTYLTISGKNLPSLETFKMTKEAQALNLMTREIDIEDVPSNQRFYSDALMLLMKSDVLEDSNEFQEYFRLIQSTKIKKSLIVFTTKVTDEDIEQLES